jgi:hypothetical protein
LGRLAPLVPSLGREEVGDGYRVEDVYYALDLRALPGDRRRRLWVVVGALLGRRVATANNIPAPS